MRKYFIIITFILVLAACKGGGRIVPNVRQDDFVISGLSGDKWTYFSFESGEVVGQSTFGSEEDDAAWAQRGDWDIAICGDRLKTNGGDSGNGLGGIIRDTEHNFVSLEEAPLEGYVTDEKIRVR